MKYLADHIKAILAMLVVILGFAYFFLSTFLNVKPNDQIIIAIVGSMTTALGYYFGSNTGSSKKDDTIQELTKKQNETT